MISARYECEVRLAGRPVINLFTNTNAEVSLAGAASPNATLARATGVSTNSPYMTGFRMTGNGSAQSYFTVGGDTGGLRNGMEPGKTYTARATIELGGPLGGTVHAAARTVQLTYRRADGTFVDTFSPAAPNAAGVYDLAVTVAIPAGATQAFVRFNHGHSTGVSTWYRLRLSEGVETDFFDGLTNHAPSASPASGETGWDGAAGLSRSWRIPPGGAALPEAVFTELSYDRMRVPFVQAKITLPYPGAAIWADLDPRVKRERILYFTAKRLNDDGSVHSRLPTMSSGLYQGKLWLRSAIWNPIKDTVTLTASSGEVKLEDKKRMAGTVLDTGATTIQTLWEYAQIDVGEAASLGGADGGAAEPLPAGDRRLWMPGESASNLFEAELAGLLPPLRSYCNDKGGFTVARFTQPPGFLASHDLYLGDDGTIIDIDFGLSRETGWADSTLVKASYTDGAGTQQTKYQNDTAGVNVAGQVVTINRDIPGSWFPTSHTNQAALKGRTARIVALADLLVGPGQSVSVWQDGVEISRIPRIDTVDFNLDDGTMTLDGTFQ